MYQSGQCCPKLPNAVVCCRIATAMAVQHVELGDIRSGRKRIFINTETTTIVSGRLS